MALELDDVLPSTNSSILLKEKFSVSVSYQEPAGVGQKEDKI